MKKSRFNRVASHLFTGGFVGIGKLRPSSVGIFGMVLVLSGVD